MADTSYAPSSPSLGRPVRGGAHPPWPERDAGRPARRFLLAFLGLFLGGIGALAGLHMALAHQALLPPPPLAATDCIDGKLALLREAPLEDRTLIAVGSSVTWRNLDMGLLEQRLPGVRAYNAAPCLSRPMARYCGVRPGVSAGTCPSVCRACSRKSASSARAWRASASC